MSLRARRARNADAFYLSTRLRQADLDELQANTGGDPLATLMVGRDISDPAYTIIDDIGLPVAMFGVVPTNVDRQGVMWLLGTDELRKHSRDFLRQSRPWIERLHKKYTLLYNVIDKRNKVHLRWLKFLGCNFVGEVIHGVENRPFVQFIHV